MAGNAIRHGLYVEPTLVDSVDFWEKREAERHPPQVILRNLEDAEIMEDYFDRSDELAGFFEID